MKGPVPAGAAKGEGQADMGFLSPGTADDQGSFVFGIEVDKNPSEDKSRLERLRPVQAGFFFPRIVSCAH